ncbi:MAG TPA: DNA polymerase domain-containing protein, partial [Methanosarcina sp.]|nr:DNA polymerase domain-containing protein [Methanosarcina sp.]
MTKEKNKYLGYTYVDRDGNDILFMGYDNEGNPVKERVRFRPEIFLEKPNGPYSTLSGKTCERKEFNSISECNEFTKQYKDIMKLYGCSDYSRQFTGRTFKGDLVCPKKLITVGWFDIETKVAESGKGDGFPYPETAYEEILLITIYDRTRKKVTTWGRYAVDDPSVNGKQKEGVVQEDLNWMKEHNVDYRMFSSEESMLKDFLMFIKTTRFDILSGWNSDLFDVPYLYNRISNVLGEEFALHMSPWKKVTPGRVFINDKEHVTYEISGINFVDLLELYKKFNPGGKESFSLDFISNFEVGESKVDLPGEDFKDNYKNYWSTFVKYNIIDAFLLEKIDQKKQIIDLCMTIAYMSKCNFGDVVSAMRVWEPLIYNYFMEKNIVEDWNKPKVTKRPLVGAYVHIPKPGFYKWAVSIDATSLYPSIMMMLNLSPDVKKRKTKFVVETKELDKIDNMVSMPYFTHDNGEFRTLHKFDPSVFDRETEYVAANGCVTDKTKDGFMRILIRSMFDERKNAKNKMLELKKIKGDPSEIAALNMKQNALKVNLNSLYGCLSMQYFRYFDNDLAEAVTMTGQMIIQKTAMETNRILNRIVGTENVVYAFYMDTDSCYINFENFVNKFCKGKEEKEIVAFLEKFVFDVLQVKINEYLDEVMANFGVPKNIVTFKLEGIANNSIWVAKKRYVSNLLYNEGVWYDPPDL